MNRNETLPLPVAHTPGMPHSSLRPDVVGGWLLPRVSHSVSTARDRAAPVFVGPVAPSVFLVHSGRSVNIAPWKELGLCQWSQPGWISARLPFQQCGWEGTSSPGLWLSHL